MIDITPNASLTPKINQSLMNVDVNIYFPYTDCTRSIHDIKPNASLTPKINR
ncbi:MAG: hypothetical protein ACI8RD_011619 [Bacillariaceae sp.]|jgi:hypothetical protein